MNKEQNLKISTVFVAVWDTCIWMRNTQVAEESWVLLSCISLKSPQKESKTSPKGAKPWVEGLNCVQFVSFHLFSNTRLALLALSSCKCINWSTHWWSNRQQPPKQTTQKPFFSTLWRTSQEFLRDKFRPCTSVTMVKAVCVRHGWVKSTQIVTQEQALGALGPFSESTQGSHAVTV